MTRAIEIVCHRGANEYTPENTYASAALCIDWQMDYLEIDVNTSRDGVMYVFHGPDLGRTTNDTRKIHESDSHDVDRLDCGAWFGEGFEGERVPRLEEFLDWIDHRIKIFFDVKFADLDRLVSQVDDRRMSDECFFWFGKERDARMFRNIAPHLPLKINVTSPAEVIEAKQRYDASIVELSLQDLSREIIEACGATQMKIMVLQRPFDPVAYAAICDWGVDLINVDHGDRFLEFLASRYV